MKNTISIAPHSDLHLKNQPTHELFLNHSEPDVIIIAGDIGDMSLSIDSLIQFSEIHPSSHLIFVPGNHEYLTKTCMFKLEAQARDRLAPYDKIHFLQCDSLVIGGTRFLGCTLWPTLRDTPSHRRSEQEGVIAKMKDFKLNYIGDEPLNIAMCRKLGKIHEEWLIKRLKTPFEGKTVTISHFCPINTHISPVYGIQEQTPFYYNDMDSVLSELDTPPDLMISGHTHHNFDFINKKTRFLTNQQGHPGEKVLGYRPNLIIEL